MFLKFFGLNEQPFGVTPDPRFLYMSPAHEEAFASLVYGIETGRGFVALIAGPGLGKTTILMRLMDRLQESSRTAFLFQTHLQSSEFLRSVFADLGVEPPGGSLGELQRQFSEVLVRESQAGRRVVIAIDEAQNLDDSTLEMVRMLSNFETSQAKLLQIVLVGQKELADKLAGPNLEQLRQRVSVITHFPPFRPDDVEKYIEHRLKVAGHTGRPLFKPAAVRLIAAQSRGIPRNINNLCFHALSLAFAQNQKMVTEGMVHEVIADLNLHRLGTRNAAPRGAAVGTVASPAAANLSGAPARQPAVDSSFSDVAFDASLDGGDFRPARPMGRSLTSLHPSPPRQSVLPFVLLACVLIAGWWAAPRLRVGFDAWIAPVLSPPPKSVLKPTGQAHDNPAAPTDLPKTNHVESVASSDQDSQPGGSALPPTAHRETAHSSAPVDLFSEDMPTAQASRQRIEHLNRLKHDPDVDDLGRRGVQSLLVVESSESGAHISINGHSSPDWVTPHLFSLVNGVYNLKVIKAGYKPWSKQIRVEGSPEHEKWLSADLAQAAPAEEDGTFAVETDPPGMQVFVDGKMYGTSRVEKELPVGWHVCEVVTAPGARPLISKFRLGEGEILTKKIRIVSATAPAGSTPTPAQTPRKN